MPLESLLTPFMLETGQVRGRVARLGEVGHSILTRYDYPPVVRRLLGELLTVVALLSSNLKQEGIFTVQIRGKGLVPLVVVDGVFGGGLRGYAEVPPESEAELRAMRHYAPRDLVGDDSYLAVTLDPGVGMQRYQGIVGLEGNSIAEALQHYFQHSEQLEVEVRLALNPETAEACGILLERLPATDRDAAEESWRYARAMLSTLTREEMLDPLLDAPAMLYRLFHEEGVRVFPPQPLSTGCRCSRTRILELLMSMNETDRADLIVDGQASVHCHFCNKAEWFGPKELGLPVN